MSDSGGLTYKAAGVDLDAGERAVALMNSAVAATRRPEVVSPLGGFAGLFDVSKLKAFKRPLLATSTDGVGTKLAIAKALDKHDTVGLDLVAMVVDDLVVCGAEPLFMTDYVACGRVVPEKIAMIVAGIANGCSQAGCSLIGGETAEHPGVMDPDDYDLAGAATGIVDAEAVLGSDRVKDGDVVIAIGSSGLHSNGYSLVRKVLLELAHWQLDKSVPELGRTLGEELLEPARIYAKACLGLVSRVQVSAFAHITGGGIPGNLGRVLPPQLMAVIDRGTWVPHPIFRIVGSVGRVVEDELERAFNMGVGMMAIVPPRAEAAAIEFLARSDLEAWVAGLVQRRDGSASVAMTGAYRW